MFIETRVDRQVFLLWARVSGKCQPCCSGKTCLPGKLLPIHILESCIPRVFFMRILTEGHALKSKA